MVSNVDRVRGRHAFEDKRGLAVKPLPPRQGQVLVDRFLCQRVPESVPTRASRLGLDQLLI